MLCCTAVVKHRLPTVQRRQRHAARVQRRNNARMAAGGCMHALIRETHGRPSAPHSSKRYVRTTRTRYAYTTAVGDVGEPLAASLAWCEVRIWVQVRGWVRVRVRVKV